MMTVDDYIERLIVRHLDGELSPEEELELNRELIRNPEARRLLEDYRRIDASASAALKQATSHGGIELDPHALTERPAARRLAMGYYRAWWLVPGAIAAALLAWIVSNRSLNTLQDHNELVQMQSIHPAEHNETLIPSLAEGIMHNASTDQVPPRIKRSTGREVFGVVGEDGSIYWIQVDRVRTLKRPNARSDGRPSREVM